MSDSAAYADVRWHAGEQCPNINSVQADIATVEDAVKNIEMHLDGDLLPRMASWSADEVDAVTNPDDLERDVARLEAEPEDRVALTAELEDWLDQAGTAA